MKYSRKLLTISLLAASIAVAEANAGPENYNSNAGGNGNGNGAANANCNSALILFCDEGNAPSGAPGPVLGGVAGLLFAFGAGWIAYRNRKDNQV